MGADAPLPPPLGLERTDFAILGGGILGTAVAALAAAAGHGVIVLRMKDHERPHADTLRNQGWLQSGVAYPPVGKFASEEEYKAIARAAYFDGRRMARMCGLPISTERGLLKVSRPDRIEDLELKMRLLRYPAEEFRRLDAGESRDRAQGLYDKGATYFLLPDAPFDEASVLRYFRDMATGSGARFLQVDAPASLKRAGNDIEISCGSGVLVAPLLLVAAGAGSVPLLRQLHLVAEASLRHTPLLVKAGSGVLELPLLVDLDHGFSAVRHPLTSGDHAVVVGTKVLHANAPFIEPHLRSVAKSDQKAFFTHLPPSLASSFRGGRFTAGYEVIPNPPSSTLYLEPFLQDFENVVFASPGRATMALQAAEKTLAVMLTKMKASSRRRFTYTGGAHEPWESHIEMHYTSKYDFDDAEK